MEIVRIPRPMRWFWGSLGAYWLADMINPGFFSVAIMALLMIPILILDMYFPPQAPVMAHKVDHAALPDNEDEVD
ncbi:MAG: hypothetical protein NTV00_09725 [Methylococcales bacterium]|nr:hypothetical protein [Methylococcales bacterium]